MDEQIRAQLREFIVANFLFGDESRLPEESESLLNAGVVDSTGVLELLDFLESDLGVVVAEHETIPDNLDSISNLVGFIGKKREAAAY